ncbi:MAG: elongation factor P hydroxylase [Oceanospirillaceae bacterium]|nr:elongation factor P hydroxylase [Oceanospirillaceae bacterium]
MVNAEQLIEAFNDCFFSSYSTCLLGDAEEPLYLPKSPDGLATIYFRFDYPSSALHEVSHWCIAGEQRRLLEDYGYWYESDTRNLQTQKQFEQVEVKPQAVECIFHWVAGLPFRVSVDNLSMPDYDAAHFEQAVMSQVEVYISIGFPKRAEIFSKYLLAKRLPGIEFNEFLKQKYEDYCR